MRRWFSFFSFYPKLMNYVSSFINSPFLKGNPEEIRSRKTLWPNTVSHRSAEILRIPFEGYLNASLTKYCTCDVPFARTKWPLVEKSWLQCFFPSSYLSKLQKIFLGRGLSPALWSCLSQSSASRFLRPVRFQKSCSIILFLNDPLYTRAGNEWRRW